MAFKEKVFSFDVLIKGVLEQCSEQTAGLKRRGKTVDI